MLFLVFMLKMDPQKGAQKGTWKKLKFTGAPPPLQGPGSRGDQNLIHLSNGA